MFGKNKILKAQNHDGNFLDVQEIFPTIQGEGPYVGHPAVFIRLGGCNLACNFCDTEFDSYQRFSLEEILQKAEDGAKNHQRKFVVITGGEPLRQPIEKLCKKLIARKFLVQIETNGTLYRELPKAVKIICSPKITNGKYHKIRPDLLERINAIKFIISAQNKDYQDIGNVGEVSKIPIYLQPMDEYDERKNQQNLQRVLKLVTQHGYLISLQTHKILGIQ